MRKSIRTFVSLIVIAATIFSALPYKVTSAGYTLGDSGYTKIATISNTYVATQGMAADENYIYTFKMPSGNNNSAIIYRTDIMTGSTVALTNAADTSTTVLSGLGHGNDMCAVVHNGKTYLYLATMYHINHSTFSAHSVWKLEVSGTTIRKVAYYDVVNGSSDLNFTGLTLISQSDDSVRLMGHISKMLFYMDIGLDQSSGTVSATYSCPINYTSATAPTSAPSYVYSSGSTSYYEVQGMTYCNEYLYFVMTASSSNTPRNKNWIFAYDLSEYTTDGSLRNNVQSETIYLTSSKYSYFLEIESLCAVNGRMYFSANAGSGSSYYSAEDFVGYFNQYFDTYSDSLLLEFETGSRENRWNWQHYISSSSTAITPAPTASAGTLSGTLGALSADGVTSTDSYVRMTAGDVYYRLESGDIIEIGMDYELLSGTAPTVSGVYFTTNNIGYDTASRMFECAHIFEDGRNVLQYHLTDSSSAAVGEIISQLRIDLFEGGSSDFSATYSIDYIYIGPQKQSPGNIDYYTGKGTHLFLDFDELSPLNEAGDWCGNNTTVTIDQSAGVMNGTINGGDPYIYFAENASYTATAGDIIQLRIRHNIATGSYSGLEFFYATTDSPSFMAGQGVAHSASSYSADTFRTIRLYLPDSIDGKTVTNLRLDPVSSAAEEALTGTYVIDYIYVGPVSKAPTANYTVQFYDENGEFLQSQTVCEGEDTSYDGSQPQKNYDAQYHYLFTGWADENGTLVSLSAITADMAVYAAFDAVAHGLTETVLTQPGCTEQGEKQFACSCGYSYTEVIAAAQHTVATLAAVSPTCTTTGLTAGSYCSVCGETIMAQQVVAATGHSVVTDSAVAATCTATGLTEGSHCSVCNAVLLAQEIITANGHTIVTDEAVEPTCTQTGLTEGQHCSVCNQVLIAQETVGATGHSYIYNPNGDETHTIACANLCGYSETVGCTYVNETCVCGAAEPCRHEKTTTDTIAVTCTQDGSVTISCDECGEILNIATTTARGHQLQEIAAQAATCTQNGNKNYWICEACGSTFADALGEYPVPQKYFVVSATGHEIVYYEAIAATCTENGRNPYYKCSVCNVDFFDESCLYVAPEAYLLIAATGHSYGYTDNGEDHTITCAACGDCATESHAYTDGVCVCGAVESTEPTYNSALSLTMNISVGAEMQVMYTILNSKVKNYDSFYVEVVKDVVGSDSVTTTFSIANSNLTEVATSAGTVVGYTATYTGIFAMEMGDNFTATLYAVDADGNIYYGDSVTASIKSYLMEKLADSTSSDELKTLAVDMLNYGAAAQVNFSYDTENLVNADLTDEQKALGTQETPSATDSASASGDASKITTSVSLQSKVLLYVNCAYAKSDDSNLEFVVKNASTGEELERFAPTIAMAKICQGIYGNVGARQMRDLITVELYDNGELVSQTLTWSIESYVAQVRADSSISEALIATVNAMLTYGDSAAAYLTASGQ